jgi:hypothetical protein
MRVPADGARLQARHARPDRRIILASVASRALRHPAGVPGTPEPIGTATGVCVAGHHAGPCWLISPAGPARVRAHREGPRPGCGDHRADRLGRRVGGTRGTAGHLPAPKLRRPGHPAAPLPWLWGSGHPGHGRGPARTRFPRRITDCPAAVSRAQTRLICARPPTRPATILPSRVGSIPVSRKSSLSVSYPGCGRRARSRLMVGWMAAASAARSDM